DHKRFTDTCNEEFHLACGTIKLQGVEALELMHALIGEMLVGHDLGPADEVGGRCELDVFYQCMQPRFCRGDLERKWGSEGIGNREDR
ncbi:hypothetical protein PISMIDRAFT_689778, partial [Pisolithus microcarpus 441]